MSSAAPGVDQESVIGRRKRCARSTVPSPCVTHSASSPDAAWDGDAPTAVRPVSTTADVPANPTTAVAIPAPRACARPPGTSMAVMRAPDRTPVVLPPDPRVASAPVRHRPVDLLTRRNRREW